MDARRFDVTRAQGHLQLGQDFVDYRREGGVGSEMVMAETQLAELAVTLVLRTLEPRPPAVCCFDSSTTTLPGITFLLRT